MRIGLVGCGRWGANILRDLNSLGCRVHVVARSHESLDRASSYGTVVIHRSVEQLPADLDGVVVATPTSTHHSIVLELLARQKCAVFVEKPLTNSRSRALEIMKEAGSARVWVMDKWRYHPGIEALATMARRHTYGRLLGVETVRVQRGNPHPDVAPIWTYLPHDIAILNEILGPTILTAAIGDQRGTHALALFRAEAGPWASIDFSSVSAQKRREVHAYFESATVSLLSERDYEFEIHDLERDEWSKQGFAPEMPMPLLTELSKFVAFIAGDGVQPKSDIIDGLHTVETIEEILARCT